MCRMMTTGRTTGRRRAERATHVRPKITINAIKVSRPSRRKRRRQRGNRGRRAVKICRWLMVMRRTLTEKMMESWRMWSRWRRPVAMRGLKKWKSVEMRRKNKRVLRKIVSLTGVFSDIIRPVIDKCAGFFQFKIMFIKKKIYKRNVNNEIACIFRVLILIYNYSDVVLRLQSIPNYSRLSDAFIERASCVCRNHERKVTEVHWNKTS